MLWVPCPAIDMPRPQERWQASGTFANGGGWVRRSAAGHRLYDLSWNLMPAHEIARIRAIFDGVYGQGPFYFIDPSAERTNVFPAAWAQPRLALDGGPTLVYDQVPSRESYPGPNRSYPSVGARYVLDSASDPNVLRLPVPEGHRLHFKAGYTNPSSATVENARQALLDALAAYTDAPVQWSATEPGDTSVVWVDPATGEARQWSAGVDGSVDDVVTRRNLVPNPSFEVNLDYWSPGSTTTTGIDRTEREGRFPDLHAGGWCMRVSRVGGTTTPWASSETDSAPVAGRFVAWSVWFDADEPHLVGRVQLQARDASGSVVGTFNAPVDEVQGGYRFVVSGEVPGEAAYFRLVTFLQEAELGEALFVDGAHIAFADTEAEALAAVETYFDGDTPDHRTDNIIYRYAWDDEPHASPSTETALGQGWHDIVDPDVVAAGQAYANAVAVAEGSAELCYRHNGGDWTPIRNIQHSVTGPGWAEFSLQGEGPVNVFWMQGMILPAHEPMPNLNQFYPGQGNSGVDFEDFQEHTHSVGVDLYGATVRLREVASWL